MEKEFNITGTCISQMHYMGDAPNCRVNNKIYEQLIYNHMMIKVIRNKEYNKKR